MPDSLGDRIKRYEKSSQYHLVHRMPIIVRVDGRAFHTLTATCEQPFDDYFNNAMINSAIATAREMQGFKAGYVQSDEATFLLTDYDTLTSQGWFDYEVNKIVSISAATMTVFFNKFYSTEKFPVFDSRVFNVPENDVVNVFVWRAKDWERNSLQMYCRAFFSQKELYGKNKAAMNEMLHGIGKNWATDVSDRYKNGTFFFKNGRGFIVEEDILPTYQSISERFGQLGVLGEFNW